MLMKIKFIVRYFLNRWNNNTQSQNTKKCYFIICELYVSVERFCALEIIYYLIVYFLSTSASNFLFTPEILSRYTQPISLHLIIHHHIRICFLIVDYLSQLWGYTWGKKCSDVRTDLGYNPMIFICNNSHCVIHATVGNCEKSFCFYSIICNFQSSQGKKNLCRQSNDRENYIVPIFKPLVPFFFLARVKRKNVFAGITIHKRIQYKRIAEKKNTVKN